MDIPAELSRRQDRLAAIAQAKTKIEERAAQRYAEEQKKYEEKFAKRTLKTNNSILINRKLATMILSATNRNGVAFIATPFSNQALYKPKIYITHFV